ncbi:methyltransferase domain-containing protein [Desulfosporosinus sp. PR]|uniref:class I SAM-dependent methyltransferase n=1 Tax=Candidatus Desulfosporosinus nitrosoreducens TaxID=3401928 RepID=UPI0027F56153|nr:methyltransferase domain-containing protein [Desulfosporosinus sp. PR]MDQ7092104.1 methyltransferase domain-containing protein [Desulfosporosinus sp. PR]
MDLRLKFNEDEFNYDKWRPNYVPELYDEIIRYSDIDETKKVIEIGIGTGQATLPILKTQCQLTAIEIGEKLAEYSRRKFASFKNLEILKIDFESFQSNNNTFDLIYSATAFHWIPEEISYTKAFDLLKSGGALALFWNHPFVNRADDLLHLEIRKVYNKYKPSDKKPLEFNKNDCRKVEDTIKRHGFINCCSKLFFQTRTFSAENYIALLNTYSDHRALPQDLKNRLENEIISAINNFGGKLPVYDTMDLYLAQKP